MTYLVHNETLFELHTACRAVTHFPQFGSTSAPAPVSAVTAAEGGRAAPKGQHCQIPATEMHRDCKEKPAGPPAHSQPRRAKSNH